ncbi:MAG: Gfo/Idh/MocA family oxidoreductase [Thermoguttaceae bacterium]|jgi:predicted dehydrogenase
MTTSVPTEFALIGAGAIAQTYACAFAQCEGIRVVGVADTRLECAQTLAAGLGCAAFRSYQEMLAASDFKAAVVCTPPSTHLEICTWLLHRGVHVLCEKPLAIDSGSAREMVDAAEGADVRFTMASKFRFVDDVIAAKAMIDSGVLGQVMLFENQFTGRVDMSKRWNSDPAISGGGVLIDNGTHSLDILRYFLGPLSDLQVVEARRHQNLPVEDTVCLFVRTAEGVVGTIDLSWSISKDQPYYISIYGAQGTLHVGWKESKYRRVGDPQWTVFGKGYDKVAAFRNQLLNFLGAIQGRQPLRITPHDAIASVEAVEAAYEAMRGTRWRPVSTRFRQTLPPVAAGRNGGPAPPLHV